MGQIDPGGVFIRGSRSKKAIFVSTFFFSLNCDPPLQNNNKQTARAQTKHTWFRRTKHTWFFPSSRFHFLSFLFCRFLFGLVIIFFILHFFFVPSGFSSFFSPFFFLAVIYFVFNVSSFSLHAPKKNFYRRFRLRSFVTFLFSLVFPPYFTFRFFVSFFFVFLRFSSFTSFPNVSSFSLHASKKQTFDHTYILRPFLFFFIVQISPSAYSIFFFATFFFLSFLLRFRSWNKIFFGLRQNKLKFSLTSIRFPS